jgi:hypothetical protein
MMALEPEPVRARRRVKVDGVWHLVVSLPILEGLAHDLSGSINYPPAASGYATFQLSNVRLAAQFGGAA